MAKRLRDACHIWEDEKFWRSGRGFIVRDLPWTSEKLRALPHFEFENWAVIALGGVPNTVYCIKQKRGLAFRYRRPVPILSGMILIFKFSAGNRAGWVG
jgi:hypothetical protein